MYLKQLLARLWVRADKSSHVHQALLLDPPSRLDVAQAFRLILGREPEEEAIDAHLGVPTVAELRRLLLTSDEFKGKYRAMHPDASSHPNLQRYRRAVIFIHLLKTGGTSLRQIIGAQFDPERRCPILEDKLHVLSVAELATYDFYAGHFDISSKTLVPRDDIQIVTMFRNPRERLISLYRFLRAHPDTDEFAQDQLIALAHKLSAEDFFERQELRGHPTINNHYLLAFGRSFSWFFQNRASSSPAPLGQYLKDAKAEIRSLTALGITERFPESVTIICHALGLTPPAAFETMHVTNNFASRDTRFRRVESVSMSDRLADAMQDLIQYDMELYDFALHEFNLRMRVYSEICPTSPKVV